MISRHAVAAFVPLLLSCRHQPAATGLRAPAEPAPDAAIRLSLDTLLAGLPADTGAACVTLVTPPPVRWLPADGALLRALTPRARRVVPASACPRTYAPGMVVTTDSLGRPLS